LIHYKPYKRFERAIGQRDGQRGRQLKGEIPFHGGFGRFGQRLFRHECGERRELARSEQSLANGASPLPDQYGFAPTRAHHFQQPAIGRMRLFDSGRWRRRAQTDRRGSRS